MNLLKSQREPVALAHTLAVTSVLASVLAQLLLHCDAEGWEWLLVAAIVVAFVLFGLALPLVSSARLRHPRLEGRWQCAQLVMGITLFAFFLLRFPATVGTGREIPLIVLVAIGLAGSDLAFCSLYAR